MSIIFTCENCGKRFKVDERSQGRRGRCSVCGHVMRIPGPAVAEPDARTAVPRRSRRPIHRSNSVRPSPIPWPARWSCRLREPDTASSGGTSPFRIRPRRLPPPAREQPHANEPHVHFELLDDDADPASGVHRFSGDHPRAARDRRVRERPQGLQASRAIEAGFSPSSDCEAQGPRAGSTRNGGPASAPCSSCFAGSIPGLISSRSPSSC